MIVAEFSHAIQSVERELRAEMIVRIGHGNALGDPVLVQNALIDAHASRGSGERAVCHDKRVFLKEKILALR